MHEGRLGLVRSDLLARIVGERGMAARERIQARAGLIVACTGMHMLVLGGHFLHATRRRRDRRAARGVRLARRLVRARVVAWLMAGCTASC